MAGLDTAGFSAVLKDFYEGELESNINDNVRAWKRHEKRTKDWEGNQVVLAIKTRRSQGYGASSGGVLPGARAVQTQRMTVGDKEIFGRVQVEERVMRKTKTDKGAFARAIRVELEGMEEGLIRSVNRQCFGVGDGKLGEVSSVAGAVVTMKTAGGSGSGINGNAGSRFIYPDQLLSVRVGHTGTGAVRLDNIRVLSVDYDAGTWTGDGAFSLSTLTAGDDVTTCIATGTDSYNNEIMGYGGLIDNGTFVATIQGLARATYPILNAAVIGSYASPATLNMGQLQQLIDLAYNNSGGGDFNVFMCHTGVREVAAAVVQVNQRYMKMSDQGQGIKESLSDNNFSTTLTYNDIPFVVDRDCPYNTIFAVNDDSIKHYQLQPFKWLDMDGAVWSRVVGIAAYEATMSYYGNLGSDHMNRNGVLRGVSQTIPTGLIPS